MQYFNTTSTKSEQKLIYRRLAMLNHPDMGGNPEVMKRINIEYDQIKNKNHKSTSLFENICIGDSIVVNKSNSIVVAVSKNTFTAKSEYTQRHALFSKSTGICINNPKFKAIIPKQNRYAF